MSIGNETYLKALAKTKNLYGDQSVGFITDGTSTVSGLKQGNTIIELLILIDTKLGVLESRIKAIEEKVGAPSTSGISKSIDDLTEKVSKLSTGTKAKETIPKGKLKVEQNPFELLKKTK